jgi:hypothetical protein
MVVGFTTICNQRISPLTLRVRIPLRWGVLDTTLCGRWFSPISSTNVHVDVRWSRKENVHRWALIQTWNVRYSARTSLRIHHHGQFLFNPPLTLRVRIPLRWGVLDTTLCGRWFSPIFSTTKTDIFIKVVLNTITLTIAPWWGIRESPVNVPLISILYNVQAGWTGTDHGDVFGDWSVLSIVHSMSVLKLICVHFPFESLTPL